MKFMKKILTSSFLLSSFALFFLLPISVQAAPIKGFEASALSAATTSISIEPGKTQEVLLTFKNIGTTTWTNKGKTHVSLYTYGPKYRASDFRADNWVDFTQAVLLKEASVAPGATGTFALSLKAPITKGTYKETFQIAAENTAWVPGGEITLSITVAPKVAEVKPAPTPVSTTTPSATSSSSTSSAQVVTPPEGLSAMVLLRSAKSVTAKGGEEISFKVGVKNTGTVTWNTREIRANDLAIASVNTKHTSWVSDSQIAVKTDGTVAPGALDFIDFKFNAPPTFGKQTVRYRLAVNNAIVPDLYIDIPVDVTSNAPDSYQSPVINNPAGTLSSTSGYTDGIKTDGLIIVEPNIRIGVLIVDDETQNQVIVSCNTPWKLMDGEGGLLGQMEAGKHVEAFYKNQRYYFNRGGALEKTEKYLRFVPDSKDAICTIENFDKRVTRRAANAENQFRDVLELRHNDHKDRTWLINELPMDEYLYGLGETSNASHEEFKKALITIARTYALYQWERATKHAKEFFHMNAYADDQVYRGYGYEIANPLIKKAVDDTKGIVIQYQGSTAITPYFSRSDGRTRDWSEVWGGSVPWVKSVPAPCDAKNNRQLWGHGVGMSATEALCMANEQGKSWQDIIHYFYTDVDLAKRWEKESSSQ